LEAEFVNAYITKQKSWIEDLVAKNIILETRLQLAETKSAQLAELLAASSAQIERLNTKSKKKSENSDSSF
jgi:hypothetical protein